MTQTWDRAWGTGRGDHEILARTSGSHVHSVMQLSNAGSGKWLIISSVCCGYTLWSVAASQPSQPELCGDTAGQQTLICCFLSRELSTLSRHWCGQEDPRTTQIQVMVLETLSWWAPAAPSMLWVLSEGLSFHGRLHPAHISHCSNFPLSTTCFCNVLLSMAGTKALWKRNLVLLQARTHKAQLRTSCQGYPES